MLSKIRHLILFLLILCSFSAADIFAKKYDLHASWNSEVRDLGEFYDQLPFGWLASELHDECFERHEPFCFCNEKEYLSIQNRKTNLIAAAMSAAVDTLVIQQSPESFSWKKELPSLIKSINKATTPAAILLDPGCEIATYKPWFINLLITLTTPIAQGFLIAWMNKQQKQHQVKIKAYSRHLRRSPREARQWNKYKRGLYTSLAARTVINSKSGIWNKKITFNNQDPLTRDEMFAYLGGTVLEPLLNTAEIIGRWIFYKKYIAAARQWYAEQYVE